MKMKKTLKIFVLILVIAQLLTLAACGGKTPNVSGGDLPENSAPSSPAPEIKPSPTENKPSPESSPPPPSPDVTKPEDTPAVPTPPASIWPTYDEAKAICEAWVDKHPDLPSYEIYEWGDGYDEAPPPTYLLFGEEYYEFYVASLISDVSGGSHVILVNAETGELLSVFTTGIDDGNMVATVEPLEDWYNKKQTESAPASLTAEEAIGIYDGWTVEHSELADYRLNAQEYDEYVIFGERYYYFHSEEYFMYWYNILVHMETGELLFLMLSDGQYAGTHIEPLDDWYESAYA